MLVWSSCVSPSRCKENYWHLCSVETCLCWSYVYFRKYHSIRWYCFVLSNRTKTVYCKLINKLCNLSHNYLCNWKQIENKFAVFTLEDKQICLMCKWDEQIVCYLSVCKDDFSKMTCLSRQTSWWQYDINSHQMVKCQMICSSSSVKTAIVCVAERDKACLNLYTSGPGCLKGG